MPQNALWHKHGRKFYGPLSVDQGRSSSVVERTLGKGEVESSILSCGTMFLIIELALKSFDKFELCLNGGTITVH